MTPVWGLDAAVVPFVAQLVGCRPSFGNCRTLAVLDRDGQMVAGLVFHNWSPENQVMEVTGASVTPKWATREVLSVACGYVFSHCQLAVARTALENTPVRRLWKAMGAEEHILPRLRGRTASEAILLLTDDAWAQSKFKR